MKREKTAYKIWKLSEKKRTKQKMLELMQTGKVMGCPDQCEKLKAMWLTSHFMADGTK